MRPTIASVGSVSPAALSALSDQSWRRQVRDESKGDTELTPSGTSLQRVSRVER
jgi:hypothetical protein